MNDYIGVQKSVLPILESEGFFGEATNEETGMVIDITKKGIKETLGSGKRFQTLPRKLKELKLATIRSLPDMIRKAHLVEDNVANSHGKSPSYAYFTVDTDINGVPFTVRIDVKKTSAKNKFWLHNIDITEKNSQLLSPEENQVLNETGNFYDDSVPQNIKMSITDNKGRALTKEQQEFFKDTKVVDADGNIKTMYHGSPAEFNVFDIKKAKSMGHYGRGFYFSDVDTQAGWYGGSTYEVYLNLTNPIQGDTRNITKEQLRKFVEAVAENEDYGLENYGYAATVDSVTDSVWGKDDFGMLVDINIKRR